jgi:DNA-binding transcriptional ArsR family regulator
MSCVPAHASVFHAIADPIRRGILDLLRDGEQTVSALMDSLRRGRRRRVTQSAFSQHLAVLRRAGLVAARKEGRTRIYSFRAQPLTEVVEWIVAYDSFWTEKLDNLGRYLERTRTDRAPEGGVDTKGGGT